MERLTARQKSGMGYCNDCQRWRPKSAFPTDERGMRDRTCSSCWQSMRRSVHPFDF